MMWPVTSQSNSMRSAARCCLTVGGANWPCSSLTKAATCTGCTAVKLIEAVILAPLGKTARGVEIGFAGVVVVDLRGEEFEDALCRLRGRREQPGRDQAGGGGDDELLVGLGHRVRAALDKSVIKDVITLLWRPGGTASRDGLADQKAVR